MFLCLWAKIFSQTKAAQRIPHANQSLFPFYCKYCKEIGGGDENHLLLIRTVLDLFLGKFQL